MSRYVLGFQAIDRAHLTLVGGKGAHLGELSRIDGVHVPEGFCITTDAYARILTGAPSFQARLDQLSRLAPDDAHEIRSLSAELRRVLEQVAIPEDLAAEITAALGELGAQAAYAVRSSATAEDLPGASFAGQQDTYLNVVGPAAVLAHVGRCWASLFTERAVLYRLRHGFDHRQVRMAVVVQRMVFPDAAGILFTADPISGNRKVCSIEASFGLGEALVSGLVNADVYQVRDGAVVSSTIGAKALAIVASASGGTEQRHLEPDQQARPALTAPQVIRLATLGRRLEAHFGAPQDIEWCLVDDDFAIVQSRPITTLFPIPPAGDAENHVYLSVGHQQMMTDALKPLGLSFWQMIPPRPMAEAGGRLWVDVTRILASPAARPGFLEMWAKGDPLTRDALQTVLDRGFIASVSDQGPAPPPIGAGAASLETDPAIPAALIASADASTAAAKREVQARSGSAVLEFIREDFRARKRVTSDPRALQIIVAAQDASVWLNDRLQAWLGEKNAADVLTQSVPHNVTSEMGLALLGVADVIRPHPEVVRYLRQVKDDAFLDALPGLTGGSEARDAIRAWLERYGMRCAGEIDITRPRWSEHPTMLVPVLLGHVDGFEAGEGERRFEEGRRAALQKEQQVLERLRALPEGEDKAAETKRMIDRVRTFAGFREYPKYEIVSRYFIYKQAVMREAERLEAAGVIRDKDDVFYLRFEELEEVVRTHQVDPELIRQRQQAFASHRALTPPRVLTSEGEGIAGSFRRDDLPPGALVGLAVSAGTVEGRARVLLDMSQAELEPGDILVTAYTDPSWTPLFLSIAGLVTEVGGMMTHGAVIAREYGLPAVVSVANATRVIRDGQRIRVHGTEGYVELLSEP